MGKLKNKAPRTGYTAPTSIMSQDVDREWKDVYPDTLEPGDIVAGMGAVLSAIPDCRNDVCIEAGQPESKEYFIDKTVKVKAFVKKG